MSEIDIVAEAIAAIRKRNYWGSTRYFPDDANFVADVVEWLQAREAAILKLHAPFKIYDECGHDHSEDESPVAFEINDVGMVCEDGYQYSVCIQCCTDNDTMTEECMNHDHGKDVPICATVALLTNPQTGDNK